MNIYYLICKLLCGTSLCYSCYQFIQSTRSHRPYFPAKLWYNGWRFAVREFETQPKDIPNEFIMLTEMDDAQNRMSFCYSVSFTTSIINGARIVLCIL